MGTRSMNYIALQPGISLPESVTAYLNKDTATILSDDRGTLIVYESNFTPMWKRPASENCTADLEAEVAIQRFLGTLAPDSFYMKRAGDELDYRGTWEKHPFSENESVKEIEYDFLHVIP